MRRQRITKKKNIKRKHTLKRSIRKLKGGNLYDDIFSEGKTKEWTQKDIKNIILSGQRIELMESAESLLNFFNTFQESSEILEKNIKTLRTIVKMRDIHLYLMTNKTLTGIVLLDYITNNEKYRSYKEHKVLKTLFANHKLLENKNISVFDGIVRTLYIIASVYMTYIYSSEYQLDDQVRTNYDLAIIRTICNFFLMDKPINKSNQHPRLTALLLELQYENEDYMYQLLESELFRYFSNKKDSNPKLITVQGSLPPLPNVKPIQQSARLYENWFNLHPGLYPLRPKMPTPLTSKARSPEDPLRGFAEYTLDELRAYQNAEGVVLKTMRFRE